MNISVGIVCLPGRNRDVNKDSWQIIFPVCKTWLACRSFEFIALPLLAYPMRKGFMFTCPQTPIVILLRRWVTFNSKFKMIWWSVIYVVRLLYIPGNEDWLNNTLGRGGRKTNNNIFIIFPICQKWYGTETYQTVLNLKVKKAFQHHWTDPLRKLKLLHRWVIRTKKPFFILSQIISRKIGQ